MSAYRSGWVLGLATLLVACHERDCGQGREHTITEIRESTVTYWRKRISEANPSWDAARVDDSLCGYMCGESELDVRYSDCRDLELDGGTAGAPSTGGDTGAGGSNGAGGAYGPIPVEGEPTYSVVCITGAIEDCGKLIR
jgi:hypothetical protein